MYIWCVSIPDKKDSITYSAECPCLAKLWHEQKLLTFSVFSLTCLFLSLPPKPRLNNCRKGAVPTMEDEGVW